MRKPDPYPLHRRFIAPAHALHDIWRVIVVVLGFEIVFEATPYLFTGPATDPFGPPAPVTALDTLVEFAAFIIPCIALLVLVRLFHRRGLGSLTGPRSAAWRDLRRVALAVGLVLLVQEPLRMWDQWDALARMRPFDQWAVMLPFAFAALLIQVGTEEIYFRGYLQQQLAVRYRNPLIWMVIPSAFFGLAHFVNGATPLDGAIWAIWAMALGLACADLTARTGNIGAAVGLHLANNVFALLITGIEDWPTSGLALWLYPYQDPWGLDPPPFSILALDLTLSLAGIWVMWLAARVALRR